MSRRGYPQDTYRDEMADAETGQRECARAEWCYDRTVTTQNGETVITGALTPRAYCDMCTGHIRECVLGLPRSWHLLAAGIGERPRAGQNSRSPFGPKLPLRENVDALMRLTAVILCGWEARVRVTARLTLRDTLASVHTIGSVKGAAETLDRNLGVLLALQPGWMTRTINLQRGPALGPTTSRWVTRVGQPPVIADKATGELIDQLRDLAGAEIVRLGVDHVTLMTQAGGEDAGAEILRLHYRSLAILGEVGQRADTLDGVPSASRVRTWRLSAPSRPRIPHLPAMYSQCASCRAQMSREDFTPGQPCTRSGPTTWP